jgi:ribosomal protein S27AE
MTPSRLADRIAALDWSGTSLQHQLAVTAAVETLRKQERDAREVPACGRCSGTGWLEPIDDKPDGSYITSRPCPRCDGGMTLANATVLPFPALRGPSPELLRGAEYNERRVTLTSLADGSTAATAILARSERWDWIVETVVEQCGCSPEDVAMVDDTVTVDGLPVFGC